VQPGNAGSYNLVVTNSAGAVTSAVATLSISGPPVVILQPASVSLSPGSTASFSIVATGTQPLAYQWRFNGTNITNGGQFSGSRTSNLTITNVQPTNVGGYAIFVTNSLGATTSEVATLSLISEELIAKPLPENSVQMLLNVEILPDDNIRILLNAAAALTCRFEVSSDLVDWTTLTNIYTQSDISQFIDLNATNFSQRFYRTVWMPNPSAPPESDRQK
jgi:hypothetical protein